LSEIGAALAPIYLGVYLATEINLSPMSGARCQGKHPHPWWKIFIGFPETESEPRVRSRRNFKVEQCEGDFPEQCGNTNSRDAQSPLSSKRCTSYGSARTWISVAADGGLSGSVMIASFENGGRASNFCSCKISIES